MTNSNMGNPVFEETTRQQKKNNPGLNEDSSKKKLFNLKFVVLGLIAGIAVIIVLKGKISYG